MRPAGVAIAQPAADTACEEALNAMLNADMTNNDMRRIVSVNVRLAKMRCENVVLVDEVLLADEVLCVLLDVTMDRAMICSPERFL